MDVGKFLNGSEIAEWRRIPGTNVEIKMRLVRPIRMREIGQQAKRLSYDGRRSTPETNADEFNRLLLDECVGDWKNIESEGKPLPCTRENKILLDNNWPAFSRTWNTGWAEMTASTNEAKEDELKN